MRVKIQLADNIKRVITFESAATIGAKLGTNLFMPNGQVGTPASVLQWLGGALPSQPSGGGNSGIPVGNYLTTKGDLLTRDTQVQRLPIGATGQALVVSAGLPAWGFVGVPGGGTGHAAYNVGDMLYADTPTSLETVGIGPDGWVLTSYGGFPTWGPVEISVSDLIDVDLTGLMDGDVLFWDASTNTWVAAPISGGDTDATYLTTTNETATLPNSRRVVAGTGIAFDDTVPSVRTINASGAATNINITPDTHPTVTNNANDEFEFGTTLDTSGSRFSGATAWAWRNQGASTWAQESGYGIFTGVGQTSANLRIVEQVVSGSAWKYRLKQNSFVPATVATQFSLGGICVVNSSSGKVIGMYRGIAGGNFSLNGDKWNSVTSYGSALTTSVALAGALVGALGVPMYFEVELSGTNLIFRYSLDGVRFYTFATEALATFITSVDRLGFILHNDTGSNQPISVNDWFRRIA